jgi:hypothetical protein
MEKQFNQYMPNSSNEDIEFLKDLFSMVNFYNDDLYKPPKDMKFKTANQVKKELGIE